MPKLYELASEYQSIIGHVIEAEGEVTPEIEQQLEIVGSDINIKIESIAKMIRNIESDADAYKAEADRLYDRAKSAKSKVDWFKSYIKSAMERMAISKVKGEIFSITLGAAPPSVQVIDDKIIPEKFWRVIPETKEIDKRAIIDNYKAGQPEVPGTMIAIGNKLTIR